MSCTCMHPAALVHHFLPAFLYSPSAHCPVPSQ
jgi:hypothetical protein